MNIEQLDPQTTQQSQRPQQPRPVEITNTVPIHLMNSQTNADFFTQEAIKKLPKPETYDGTINATMVQNFVDDISDYFQLMELSNITKMRHLRYYLIKQAKTWYLHNISTFLDFEDIMAKLKKNFEPTDFQRSLRTQFSKLRQQDSVRKFAEELRTITQMMVPAVTDSELLYRFLDGLNDTTRIQVELNCKDLISFDDAQRSAIRVDEILTRKHVTRPPPQTKYQNDPMDLDTINSSRIPKLTETERARCLRFGLCLRCRKSGHLAKDCTIVFPAKKINSVVVVEQLNKEISNYSCIEFNHLCSSSQNSLLLLNGSLNGNKITFMIDSGAQGNFISETLARTFNLQSNPDVTWKLQGFDGKSTSIGHEINGLQIRTQAESFVSNFITAPLKYSADHGYDKLTPS